MCITMLIRRVTHVLAGSVGGYHTWLHSFRQDCGDKGPHRDAGGALVQDGELGAVVEQARHAQTLLLAQAELGAPVHDSVQAALALHQVLQVHLRQQPPQLPLRDHVALARCARASTLCERKQLRGVQCCQAALVHPDT